MFIGIGTVVNVITVVVGALIGLALGNRIPERTKDTVTSVLGLFTIVLGIFSALTMTSDALTEEVGKAAMVVVLASLLVGTLVGSWLRIEDRLEQAATWLRTPRGARSLKGAKSLRGASDDAPSRSLRGANDEGASAHERPPNLFVDGLVISTLVFCVGPLTILGSISDGLGRGADQLLVKATLDGFAAMAFASTLGWGVLASAAMVGLIQGSLTALGYFAGDVLTVAQVDALTAAGGVILIGLGIRLLGLKQIPVGDLLPALLLAPLFTWFVTLFR